MKSAAVTEMAKTGQGANEAFDLLVYADALAVLQLVTKRSAGPPAPDWAQRKRGSSSRRSVLVKRYPRNMTAGAEKRRRRQKKLVDGACGR